MALTRKLDFELEMGAWIGTGNAMGKPVRVSQAEELLAGLCLLNDLSARDIQGWEMAPLGPFLSKNFGTVISPWVVTTEALAPFRRPRMAREAEAGPLLHYLDDSHDARHGGFAIELQVELSTKPMREQGEMPARISLSHSEHLYWTFAQMIAHHTVGGCNLRPGDLLGSGTISAPQRSGYGRLADITDDGKAAITLTSAEKRTYWKTAIRSPSQPRHQPTAMRRSASVAARSRFCPATMNTAHDGSNSFDTGSPGRSARFSCTIAPQACWRPVRAAEHAWKLALWCRSARRKAARLRR